MAQPDTITTTQEIEITDFDRCAGQESKPGLWSTQQLTTIQVNIGLKCNLTCRHCHVNSSPLRKEEMDWATMDAILHLAGTAKCSTVDITGGAPEMNPHFRRFVSALREKGLNVMVRTNLTILLESGYEDLPEFFRDHQVQLVASLPCYLKENVDEQRGEGVYRDSISVIRKLNEVGYGIEPELTLNLVYNPIGEVLPPDQAGLEAEYRSELESRFGIRFTHLHTITNVPIGRFRGDLRRNKGLDAYLDLLRRSFNPQTVEPLMCRHQISVAWDGSIYDCDFNLALRWPAKLAATQNVRHVSTQALSARRIVTGDHCYACTAGAGSSCGGALV